MFDANCQLRNCVIFKAGCVTGANSTYRVHGVMWSLPGAICKGRSVLSLKIYTIDLFLHARKNQHCNTTCPHRILASKPNITYGGARTCNHGGYILVLYQLSLFCVRVIGKINKIQYKCKEMWKICRKSFISFKIEHNEKRNFEKKIILKELK